MDILHSLESLILGAVPTMVLFVLLVAAYNVLVRQPLERTLAERRSRTTGAVEEARRSIAVAESTTAAYEEKLRSARAEIAGEREQRSRARQAHREQVLGVAREQAQGRIAAARLEVAASVETARQQIEASAEDLSQRIVRAILPANAQGLEVSQ